MFESFDYGWLNIGSLILGLFAWLIPAVSILRHKKRKNKFLFVASLMSMGACAIALWFQISYNHYLVQIQDWTALMDTTSTLNWVSAVLLIVTILLNVLNAMVAHKNLASE